MCKVILRLCSFLVFLMLLIRGICMPPLPDVDTCTPKSGSCVNYTSECEGFIDTWGLCRHDQLCCKPAPSTTHPEPQYPGSDVCGLITRVDRDEPKPAFKIVGGVDSEEGEWPWMVSIRDRYGHFCGGTLIASRWVLTAAHCLDGLSMEDVNLTLGEHHSAFISGNEKTVKVESWFIHPNYSGILGNMHHDIALIKTSNHVNTFGHYIRTACLPMTGDAVDDYINIDCFVSGWGSTVGSGDNRHLKHVKVPIIPLNECNDTWSGIIQDTNICAGNGETGTCRGDSGGPLICNVRGIFHLFGVTSWGKASCQTAGFPDVYTRVATYSAWIENTQKDNVFVEDVFYLTVTKMINSILNFVKTFIEKIVSGFTKLM